MSELTEELSTVQAQREHLLSVQAANEKELQQLRLSLQASQDDILKFSHDLQAAAQREKDLRQECTGATNQLEALCSDLKRCDAEKSQLIATVAETELKVSERM